jgi:formylglycine-generating enzyme required for sulfatase activity
MKYTWLSLWLFISATHAQVGDKVVLPNFSIDRTEVTIAQFDRYVQATGTVTRAEKEGEPILGQPATARKAPTPATPIHGRVLRPQVRRAKA